MNVNRSGYYKWKNRKSIKTEYQKARELLTKLLKEAHEKHKSYGYHRLATVIRLETGWMFSDNLAHKCCRYEGIKSKAKHYKYRKTGEENTKYPNLVNGKWSASRPLEIVVSDMTCIPNKNGMYEWTYLLDTFNNEIIAHHISKRQNDRKPYFSCLEDLKAKIKEQTNPIVLHTDQGSVYSSRAFYEAHKEYNIIRSMSRVGTPTDNPIIESINGWIKAELKTDFESYAKDDLPSFMSEFVDYFNNERPAYSLNYKTPIQYKAELGFA